MARRKESSELDKEISRYRQTASFQLANEGGAAAQARKRNWRRFAAAAGASVSMAAAADAEVHYFSPPSPIRLELIGTNAASDAFGLDIDGDNVPDIDIRLSQDRVITGSVLRISREAAAAGANAANAVIGSSNYAFNILSAGIISASRPQTFDGRLFAEVRSVTSSSTITEFDGQWPLEGTGFLGAKFQKNGPGGPTDHLAWIRVRTDFQAESNTLLDILNWAYESVPNKSIRAGDEIGTIEIPGDYDDNRVVNELDYLEWKNTFGQSRIPGEAADGNGNGVVDSGDYTIWRDNYIASDGSASASSAQVPEPGTLALALLALGAAGVAALRTRRSELEPLRCTNT